MEVFHDAEGTFTYRSLFFKMNRCSVCTKTFPGVVMADATYKLTDFLMIDIDGNGH